jgi:hypothetical protein
MKLGGDAGQCSSPRRERCFTEKARGIGRRRAEYADMSSPLLTYVMTWYFLL